MTLTWEGIKGAIEAAKALATGAAKLENAKEKADAATKINELSDVIRELWDKVSALETENRELKSKLESQAQFERHPKGYYTEKGTGRAICGLCWENGRKQITLLPERYEGPAESVDGHGYGSWTELLKCPACKTEYDRQEKRSEF